MVASIMCREWGARILFPDTGGCLGHMRELEGLDLGFIDRNLASCRS